MILRTLLLFAIAGTLMLMACGSSTSSGNTGSGTDDSKVRLSGSVSQNKSITIGSKSVTHVYAVSTISHQTALAEVAADGSFQIDIDKSKPWVIVFIDNTRIGKDMIVASYKSSDFNLNSLAPSASAKNSMDMAEVSIDDANGIAQSSAVAGTVLDALGLSQDQALYWGSKDDVCLRYINPDIDGDGVVDSQQTNNQFLLDFHNRFSAQINGVNASLADIKNQFLDATKLTYVFTGTGIFLGLTTSYSSAITASSTFTLTYPDATVENFSGSAYPSNNGTDLMFGPTSKGDFANTAKYDGEYLFNFGSGAHVFTFPHVKTSDLQFKAGFLTLSVRIDTDGSSNDFITGVQYKWLKCLDPVTPVWTEATLADLELLLMPGAAGVSMSYNPVGGSSVFFSVPTTSIAGSVPVSAASISGISESQRTSLRFVDFGNPGISYDDKRGMRFFVF